MTVDPLEFGQLLMRKRRALKVLGRTLSTDLELVDAALRCTLCEAWYRRAHIDTEQDLDRLLSADLREKVRCGPGECGFRWPVCSRFEHAKPIE